MLFSKLSQFSVRRADEGYRRALGVSGWENGYHGLHSNKMAKYVVIFIASYYPTLWLCFLGRCALSLGVCVGFSMSGVFCPARKFHSPRL